MDGTTTAGTVSVVTLIAHVDADSFFVSVEQALRPGLVGRPVVVGEPSGMILAASWEAKLAGARTTEPVALAKRLIPGLVVLRSRYGAYRRASADLHELLGDLLGSYEPISIDEAFFDVAAAADRCPHDPATHTDDEHDRCHAAALADELRQLVRQRLGIGVSVGIGPTRQVAKLSSRAAKPDGVHIVGPAEASAFVMSHPLASLWGIGPATVARLEDIGITTTTELATADPAVLQRSLGPSAGRLVELANGRDDSSVHGSVGESLSMSVERSWSDPGTGERELANRFRDVLGDLLDRFERDGRAARRLDVRVSSRGEHHHCGVRLGAATRDVGVLTAQARLLWDELGPVSVTRVSVTLSQLDAFEQLSLLPEPVAHVERDRRPPTFEEVAYRSMPVSHPLFGAGMVLEALDDAWLIRFGTGERLLDRAAPLSFE